MTAPSPKATVSQKRRPTVPRPTLVVALLAAALIVGVWPFMTGLVGGPVLYALFKHLHEWLSRRLPSRMAAGAVVVIALGVVVTPGVLIAGVVVSEAEELAGQLTDRPVMGRLADLRIGPVHLGPRLIAAGEQVIDWLGSNIPVLVGGAATFILNIAIAMFGLFFLLLQADRAWDAVRPYIPFTEVHTDKLRRRFYAVTYSTVIGTGLAAVAQGTLVGFALWIVGVSSPLFWGGVTAVFAVVPLVGSGAVWIPATIGLLLNERVGAAAGLLLWGTLVVASIDNLIRPVVYRRWAHVHPMVTLVGAVAGIRFFGLLGLLIGPLALSYFFEFLRMLEEEGALSAPSRDAPAAASDFGAGEPPPSQTELRI